MTPDRFRAPAGLALASALLLLPGATLADEGSHPYGGLRGEALEAAREGADADPYVDPDKDPKNRPGNARAEGWGDLEPGPAPDFFADEPTAVDKEPGLLGDGEIIIRDGKVTEGLIETD